MMSRLTVLVGLPGSGKSTSIPKDFKGFVYSTDRYIEAEAASEGKTYNEGFPLYIKDATSVMDHSLKFSLEQKYDVIWDQTNMAPKKRRSIVSKFNMSYYKECMCIAPPRSTEEWGELNRRLASRPGKNIPDHIVKSMAASYVEPELDEGFDFIRVNDMFGKMIVEKGNKK